MRETYEFDFKKFMQNTSQIQNTNISVTSKLLYGICYIFAFWVSRRWEPHGGAIKTKLLSSKATVVRQNRMLQNTQYLGDLSGVGDSNSRTSASGFSIVFWPSLPPHPRLPRSMHPSPPPPSAFCTLLLPNLCIVARLSNSVDTLGGGRKGDPQHYSYGNYDNLKKQL